MVEMRDEEQICPTCSGSGESRFGPVWRIKKRIQEIKKEISQLKKELKEKNERLK